MRIGALPFGKALEIFDIDAVKAAHKVIQKLIDGPPTRVTICLSIHSESIFRLPSYLDLTRTIACLAELHRTRELPFQGPEFAN